MFDHHQEPRESRPNGVPYAAFGLLWRGLGAQLVEMCIRDSPDVEKDSIFIAFFGKR